MEAESSHHITTDRWSSQWSFIMAAAGAAVGLGNIWRFPYIVGENGGGAFVLTYLFFVMLLGIPLMFAEISIGRRTRHNPIFAFREMAARANASMLWQFAGALMVLSVFLIVSYYTVITGWVLHYIGLATAGRFDQANLDIVTSTFDGLMSRPLALLTSTTMVVVGIVKVMQSELREGLEKLIYLMFPLLILLMLLLVIYGVSTGDFISSIDFLFKPHFARLGMHGVLLALGQAFFSLGVGMSIIMTFGAYLPKEISIKKASVVIAGVDTGIALLAGLAIFPIVFATPDLNPATGPSLIFKTLPIAFSHIPMGQTFLTFFFIMLFFAAFTSAVAMFEPPLLWLMEFANLSRAKATTYLGLLVWIVSLGSVFSFNLGSNLTLFKMTFFQLLDYLTANWMLPICGILLAIFLGFIVPPKETAAELHLPETNLLYRLWLISMRYIAPIAISIVLFG